MRIRLKDPLDVHIQQKYEEWLRSIGKGYLLTPRRRLDIKRRARALVRPIWGVE